MKKVVSLVLAALMLIGSFISCGEKETAASATIATTSSNAEKYAEWLEKRLGYVPENVVLGIGSHDDFGIDMIDFEDDGYIIRTAGDSTLVFGKTEDGLDRAVRAYAKATEAGMADGMNETFHEGYRVKKLTVAGRDISEYSIYIDGDRDQCHTFAAQELRTFIGRACGFYPDITDTPTEHMIILEQVMPEDSRFNTLGDEGFTISVKENGDLYISGGRYRGCLFGVFEFLEKYVGWRFYYDYYNMESYTSDYTKGYIDYLYEAELIDIPVGLSDTQTPDVSSRRMIKTLTDVGVYGYRVKDNYHLSGNAGAGIEGKFVEKFNAYGIRRTANHGILQGPYKDFVDYEGPSPYSNPCYSNEENIQVSIDYYTDYVYAMLDAGKVIGKDFLEVDVAQVDSPHYCTCETCIKYITAEGGFIGPVLYFTNCIAEEIAKIDPDIYVQMLAYMGTCSVPKTMRPLENVSVAYCFFVDVSRYFCDNHPLDGTQCTGVEKDKYSVNNYEAAEELRGWNEICDHITVWYYPGNWNFTAITSGLLTNTYYDMQFLLSFENVDAIFSCPSGFDNIMGYYRPEEMFVPFLLARLSWNKDITFEQYLDIVREYFYIICGDGADEIMEYLLLVERCELGGCWTTFAYSEEFLPSERMNYTLFAENFDLMIELYNSAMSKADTEWQENYIEDMTLTMYLTGLVSTYESWYVNGDDASREKYAQYYEHFKKTALKHDFYIGGYIEDKVYLRESHFNIEENPETIAFLGKQN